MQETQTTSGTVVGYFEDHADAQKAVEALQDAGFTSAHVGVAHRGGSTSTDASSQSTSDGHSHAHDGEGVWDKVKNFFGGDVEPYADERTQGQLASREITQNPSDTYGGTNYGGSDTYGGYDDHFHENFTSMDVPEDRSRYFSHRFGSSTEGAVVTVNAGPRNQEAEEILRRYGADLGDNAASYDYSSAPATNRAEQEIGNANLGTSQERTGQLEGRQNIQLLGELLRVQKERVSRGEVRLRKEVVTETQTVQVPVTREELVIERRPVAESTQASGTIGNAEEIRIPLTEETASLDKSTVVREEVSVGKKAVGQVRDLTGDVRHEELVVDDDTKKVANG